MRLTIPGVIAFAIAVASAGVTSPSARAATTCDVTKAESIMKAWNASQAARDVKMSKSDPLVPAPDAVGGLAGYDVPEARPTPKPNYRMQTVRLIRAADIFAACHAYSAADVSYNDADSVARNFDGRDRLRFDHEIRRKAEANARSWYRLTGTIAHPRGAAQEALWANEAFCRWAPVGRC